MLPKTLRRRVGKKMKQIFGTLSNSKMNQTLNKDYHNYYANKAERGRCKSVEFPK
jgi:hypothetical protein